VRRQTTDCAIVGFAARYPLRRRVDEFWDALNEDRSLIQEMPESRRKLLHNAQSGGGKHAPRHGMFLEDVSCFDRSLFSMSPPSAMFADPRERLLLECSWAAIEDAGFRKTELADSTVGVFIGQDSWYWGPYADTTHPEYIAAQEFILPGNNPAFLASRIAALFGFRGPSLAPNTTCSSVYTALHYACGALRDGACDYALVGGVTVFHRPPPDRFESPSNAMLSFSADADGYVSSEGCGAFLLCRSELAAKSRLRPHATLCASGCNSGGTTNSFFQPSQTQLVALLHDTLSAGGLRPEQIGYVEAHGIASPMGDAIEANALNEVLGRPGRTSPCLISTIKPSIGHCHAASGVYSLIKAILALHHQKIPAIFGLRQRQLNSAIDVETNGLQFLTEAASWPRNGVPRYVLLPSFGFGNGNAAIILREAPMVPSKAVPSPEPPQKVMVCLSARSRPQLATQIANLHRVVAAEIEAQRSTGVCSLPLNDIAHTLQVGREAFRHRWATVVDSLEGLSEALANFPLNKAAANIYQSAGHGNDLPAYAAGKEGDPAPAAEQVDQPCDVEKLAALWTSGTTFTWPDGLNGVRPRRAHLPTYPFAREHYWLPELTAAQTTDSHQPAPSGVDEAAHATSNGRQPLLRRIQSSSPEILYRAQLRGHELCIPDHRIHGRLVLSGAAHVDLALAAFQDLVGGNGRSLCLRGHVWQRPLATESVPVDVYVRMAADALTHAPQEGVEQSVRYEICSSLASGNSAVYSCGVASTPLIPRPQPLELRSLVELMTHGAIGAKECYSVFRDMGLDYGPAHRGIKEIYLGRDEVLAKLVLSRELYGESGHAILHPGLLDSAFQAYVGVALGNGKRKQAGEVKPELLVPFGLDYLEVFEPLPATMYCWLRRSTTTSPGRVSKFDLDLCGEDGVVFARGRGFSLRSLLQPDSSVKSTSQVTAPQNGGARSSLAGTRNGPEPSPVNAERLAPGAEAQVRQVIATVLRVPAPGIESDTPFKEYGIDSLLASTITVELEKFFGSLPKTLFFEFENIRELAAHLDANRADRPLPARPAGRTTKSLVVNKTDVTPGTDLHRRLEAWGETAVQNSVLFDLWPQLFISRKENGCLHILKRDHRIFATGNGYARITSDQGELVEELADYCREEGLALSFLSMTGPLGTGLERRSGLLSLPVGCFQTIENLSTFSLAGAHMRRLRYMVQRFQRGAQRTVEYLKADQQTDDAIRAVLLGWSRPKGTVSNVNVVLRDLEQGVLLQRYRVFLTYSDDVLQNVIMVLPIEGGYLMDQEYYLPTMPLGGTESAATSIIDTLRKEGHRRFSLGLTWRRFSAEEAPEFSDLAGQKFLAECSGPIATMLDHGERNYQHKSKYRPSEKPMYLYRPESSEPQIIRQSLLEFVATGLTIPQVEELISVSRESSAEKPAEPVRAMEAEIASAEPEIQLNLMSDSWPYHDAPFVHQRMAGLSAIAANAAAATEHADRTFAGLPAVLTMSGRLAERLFFRSFPRDKKVILQNLLF